MRSFADVLHGLIDKVFSGNDAEEAHTIIDGSTGTRTPEEEAAPPEVTEAPAETTADTTTEAAAPVEEAPPTPGG